MKYSFYNSVVKEKKVHLYIQFIYLDADQFALVEEQSDLCCYCHIPCAICINYFLNQNLRIAIFFRY